MNGNVSNFPATERNINERQGMHNAALLEAVASATTSALQTENFFEESLVEGEISRNDCGFSHPSGTNQV